MSRIRYPRLYMRMALYIGAALTAFVLIGALAFASIAAWELSGYLKTRNSEIARDASTIVDAGGIPALKKWLRNEAKIPEDVSVYVLDEAGHDILGQAVPDMYRTFIQSYIVDVKREESSHFRPVRMASQVIAEDGSVYSFLIVPRNVTLLGSIATALSLIVAALLVIASIAWLIAGRFGRPIGELQQAVRNLAAGDTSARVPDSIAARKDELGQLAHDFNSMADHLNQLIEGRERLMRELSHELRSPLTRLQAALALAAARNRLDADGRQRVDNEIGQMNKVIGEILRYAALDNSVRMRIRLVRIDELLHKLVDVEEIEARTKNCVLRLQTERNLEVAGNTELLTSAFENILRNAIRFAPEGSTIDIDAAHSTHGIQVRIRDQGPGIPPDERERIFEPYVRASNASGGSGLGLAIVKRVIERHGGQIRAEAAPGGGLQMTALIPAAEFT